jgi:elongation factor 2
MFHNGKITSIVAHIDHGKTTLIDSLIASQGFISKSIAGDLRYLDNRADEQERGITLKLSPIKLKSGLIFIDTPGHVDFESLIFCSSILSDNHLILVDVNEGITPRTYSLIKYINKQRTILVLNKVDKCDDFDTVQMVLYQLNGLIGEDIFSWEKNNVILAAASLCSGVCYRKFTMSKKNTLSNAFKAFKLLNDKFEKKELKEVALKYKINYITRKSIFSAVFPLCDSVFDCINMIYETIEDSLPTLERLDELINLSIKDNPDINAKTGYVPKEESIATNELHIGDEISSLKEENTAEQEQNDDFEIKNDFYEIKSSKKPEVLAISVYGMLKKKLLYIKENLLFVCKILFGTLKRGQKVICINNIEMKEVVIEKIYEFSVDTLEQIDSVTGPTLVALEGDFLKNCVISTSNVEFHLNDFMTPFYKSKLVLSDLSQLESLKDTIRCMSYTEQSLKAKKNKFIEIEIKCSGKVQFEKMCHDFEKNDFKFTIKKTECDFKEFVQGSAGFHYKDRNIEFKIRIAPKSEASQPEDFKYVFVTDKTDTKNLDYLIEHCSTSSNHSDDFQESSGQDLSSHNDSDTPKSNDISKTVHHINGNIFEIQGKSNMHIIESVLEIFVVAGPLIKESIINTLIHVELIKEGDSKIYNILKNKVSDLYMKCNPSICPMFYSVKISIEMEYLGAVYNILQKYNYIMDDESFDEKTNFFVLNCKIPQFLFNEFIEDLRVKTKGSAYLEAKEYGYIDEGDFSKYVDTIKAEKGMYFNEKIIENPEKQRTLKR